MNHAAGSASFLRRSSLCRPFTGDAFLPGPERRLAATPWIARRTLLSCRSDKLAATERSGSRSRPRPAQSAPRSLPEASVNSTVRFFSAIVRRTRVPDPMPDRHRHHDASPEGKPYAYERVVRAGYVSRASASEQGRQSAPPAGQTVRIPTEHQDRSCFPGRCLDMTLSVSIEPYGMVTA